MIVCTKCGTENPDGTQFCVKCGKYLDWSGVKVAVQVGSAVSATLKNQDVVVDPGGQASSEVEVNNDGRLVDEYRLQVRGADPSWCSVEPASLRLMPRTSASARVLFRPPRAPNPAAGTGPFVVAVSSSVDPTVRSEVAGSLTIKPFADVAATVAPQTSESFRIAEHTVSVENRGNAVARVALSAQDADNRLTCEVTPPNLMVGAGSIARSTISVRPTGPKEPRNGRRVAFQVLVQPATGTPIRLEAATVLLEPPVSWWSRWRFVIAAALALLLTGGVVAYAGPPYPHWPPVPQSSPPPPPGVAKVTTNPPSISFGTVQVGAGSAAVPVVVANNGNAKTMLTPTLSNTNDFSMQDLCSSAEIAPGQQCQLQISFSPKSEGDFQGMLSFAVSSGEAPKAVALSGRGQGVALLSCTPPSLSFNITGRASVALTTSISQSLTCTNSGNGALTITSVVLQDSSGKFSIQPNCVNTLAPGANCTVSVQFSTSTLGTTFSASILFNDSLGQQVVPVSGYRGYLYIICLTCTKYIAPTPSS
jgi:Abnormal spindle-like microcephaly-assoc'd, ASPM-SPD-2-Hydin/zinc-ribbon domain